MKCAYHLDRDAVGICVNCEKAVCSECRVIRDDRTYCNPCVQKLLATKKAAGAKDPSLWFTVGSILCALIAVLFLPPVFGGLGIYLGYRTYKYNPGRGIACMVVSAVGLVLGIVLAAIIVERQLY